MIVGLPMAFFVDDRTLNIRWRLSAKPWIWTVQRIFRGRVFAGLPEYHGAFGLGAIKAD